MLDFLTARATPGVEAVEAGSYRRTISLHGRAGYFEVSLDDPRSVVLVRIEFGDRHSFFVIVERIRAMFDLNADWAAIAQSLKGDPALAASIEADPGLRVPGCWNGFELASRAILGQQVTVKGATTLAGRMVSTLGKPFRDAPGLTHLFPTPDVLAAATLAHIDLSGGRAATIRAFARAVCTGRINFEVVVDTNAFLSSVCEIPGIGTWTAQYVAMRALGEPDAFPSTDLVLLRALASTSSLEL